MDSNCQRQARRNCPAILEESAELCDSDASHGRPVEYLRIESTARGEVGNRSVCVPGRGAVDVLEIVSTTLHRPADGHAVAAKWDRHHIVQLDGAFSEPACRHICTDRDPVIPELGGRKIGDSPIATRGIEPDAGLVHPAVAGDCKAQRRRKIAALDPSACGIAECDAEIGVVFRPGRHPGARRQGGISTKQPHGLPAAVETIPASDDGIERACQVAAGCGPQAGAERTRSVVEPGRRERSRRRLSGALILRAHQPGNGVSLHAPTHHDADMSGRYRGITRVVD